MKTFTDIQNVVSGEGGSTIMQTPEGTFLFTRAHCSLFAKSNVLGIKNTQKHRQSVFGKRSPVGTRTRAHTGSCKATAPPSGQLRALRCAHRRRRRRAQELGAGAGPGLEGERTVLLRDVNAHPGFYFPRLLLYRSFSRLSILWR